MSASSELDILVYGLGAIGSFYTFILSRNSNVRLTVVARSNYDAVSKNGIKLISNNHGEHHITPHKVVRNVADAGQKFDYIVCAHKAIDQDGVPPHLEPGVDESRTTIVIIQNGVGNEEPFRKAFPSTSILSCVTWCGTRQTEPGVIVHKTSEDMQIGLFPNPLGDATTETRRLQEFTSLLAAGKTKFQAVPDIQVNRWEKVVWNAAWNPLTALTLLDTHSWLSSSEFATPMTRRLMNEVINVAKALGVNMADDLVERLFARILALPPIGSSMRTDFEAGRVMEVEAILGYPVKKGRELGIDVTTIETLHTILTAVNGRFAGSAAKA